MSETQMASMDPPEGMDERFAGVLQVPRMNALPGKE